MTITKHCIALPCENMLGAPERIRTSDPQLRRLMLYPSELQAQFTVVISYWGLVVRKILLLQTKSLTPLHVPGKWSLG